MCRLQLISRITQAHVLQPPGLPAIPVGFRGINSGGAEAIIHLQGKEIFLDILLKQRSFAALKCNAAAVCVCVAERFNYECQTLVVGSIS